MKYVSIFSVTLKSAMTPSFIGLMATMLPGVRPSISLASLPTASTSLVFLFIATIEGSLTTMPLPRAYTRVLAVPKSMARSLEKMLNSDRRLCERDEPLLYPLLDDIPDRVSLYKVDSLTCTSHPGLAEEIPSPHLRLFGIQYSSSYWIFRTPSQVKVNAFSTFVLINVITESLPSAAAYSRRPLRSVR